MAKERKISIGIYAKSMMQRGLAKATAALHSFGKSALKIGGFFAKGFLAAGAAVAGFAAKALQSYAVQEKAEQSVIAVNNAMGESGRALLPMYKRIASAIQDETGVADESTLAKMAQLRMLGVTNDQMEEATKGLVALKKAGMGEESASRAVAAAMQGNYQMLTRYIPALRNATDEAEKASIVNDFLTKGYNAQKEELNTVSGQWNLLKGRVGDVWEEIGRAIAQNDGLMESLKRAGEAVKAFGERVTSWAKSGGMVNLITTVKHFANEASFSFKMIGNTALLAFASISDSFETAWNYLTGVANAGADLVVGSFQRIGKVATAVFNAIKKPSRAAFAAIADAVKDSVDGNIEDIKAMGRALAGENASITKRTEAALNARAKAQEKYAARTKKISEDQAKALKANAEKPPEPEPGPGIGGTDQSAEKRKALLKEEKKLQKELAAAEKRREQDKLSALRSEIRVRERVAQMSVRQYIDEVTSKRRADAQWERDKARAGRLQGRTEQGAKDFVSAVESIKKARESLPDMQQQLKASQEQTRTMKTVATELKQIHGNLKELLAAG